MTKILSAGQMAVLQQFAIKDGTNGYSISSCYQQYTVAIIKTSLYCDQDM